MNNRTIWNREANKILKNKFERLGITRCEYPNCGSTSGLTWCHLKKRRYYNSVEELSDFKEVLLICLKHHQFLEVNQTELKELFKTLRGN